MALFLKDPEGNAVILKHISLCIHDHQILYLVELFDQMGIYTFYSVNRSERPSDSRRKKMSYDKLAAIWRRFGRRFSASSDCAEVRIWDCRKLIEERESGRIGVLAILLEVATGEGREYVGYYGTLFELSGFQKRTV
jgi:hypothetical protein